MKRRLTKKWIKRYIRPLIINLPKTTMAGWEIDNGDNQREYFSGKNHSIKNGFLVDEGCKVPPSTGMRSDILRAAKNIQVILDNYHTVYIRIEPTVCQKKLRMRLITEKVTT